MDFTQQLVESPFDKNNSSFDRYHAANLIIGEDNYMIYTKENLIGRAELCDIVISKPAVSSRHAIIEVEDKETHVIYDLGSTNKTFLGKMTLKPHIRYYLRDGEIVTFGNVKGIYNYFEEPVGINGERSGSSTPKLIPESPEKCDMIPGVIAETPCKDNSFADGILNETSIDLFDDTISSLNIHELGTAEMMAQSALKKRVNIPPSEGDIYEMDTQEEAKEEYTVLKEKKSSEILGNKINDNSTLNSSEGSLSESVINIEIPPSTSKNTALGLNKKELDVGNLLKLPILINPEGCSIHEKEKDSTKKSCVTEVTISEHDCSDISISGLITPAKTSAKRELFSEIEKNNCDKRDESMKNSTKQENEIGDSSVSKDEISEEENNMLNASIFDMFTQPSLNRTKETNGCFNESGNLESGQPSFTSRNKDIDKNSFLPVKNMEIEAQDEINEGKGNVINESVFDMFTQSSLGTGQGDLSLDINEKDEVLKDNPLCQTIDEMEMESSKNLIEKDVLLIKQVTNLGNAECKLKDNNSAQDEGKDYEKNESIFDMLTQPSHENMDSNSSKSKVCEEIVQPSSESSKEKMDKEPSKDKKNNFNEKDFFLIKSVTYQGNSECKLKDFGDSEQDEGKDNEKNESIFDMLTQLPHENKNSNSSKSKVCEPFAENGCHVTDVMEIIQPSLESSKDKEPTKEIKKNNFDEKERVKVKAIEHSGKTEKDIKCFTKDKMNEREENALNVSISDMLTQPSHENRYGNTSKRNNNEELLIANFGEMEMTQPSYVPSKKSFEKGLSRDLDNINLGEKNCLNINGNSGNTECSLQTDKSQDNLPQNEINKKGDKVLLNESISNMFTQPSHENRDRNTSKRNNNEELLIANSGNTECTLQTNMLINESISDMFTQPSHGNGETKISENNDRFIDRSSHSDDMEMTRPYLVDKLPAEDKSKLTELPVKKNYLQEKYEKECDDLNFSISDMLTQPSISNYNNTNKSSNKQTMETPTNNPVQDDIEITCASIPEIRKQTGESSLTQGIIDTTKKKLEKTKDPEEDLSISEMLTQPNTITPLENSHKIVPKKYSLESLNKNLSCFENKSVIVEKMTGASTASHENLVHDLQNDISISEMLTQPCRIESEGSYNKIARIKDFPETVNEDLNSLKEDMRVNAALKNKTVLDTARNNVVSHEALFHDPRGDLSISEMLTQPIKIKIEEKSMDEDQIKESDNFNVSFSSPIENVAASSNPHVQNDVPGISIDNNDENLSGNKNVDGQEQVLGVSSKISKLKKIYVGSISSDTTNLISNADITESENKKQVNKQKGITDSIVLKNQAKNIIEERNAETTKFPSVSCSDENTEGIKNVVRESFPEISSEIPKPENILDDKAIKNACNSHARANENFPSILNNKDKTNTSVGNNSRGKRKLPKSSQDMSLTPEIIDTNENLGRGKRRCVRKEFKGFETSLKPTRNSSRQKNTKCLDEIPCSKTPTTSENHLDISKPSNEIQENVLFGSDSFVTKSKFVKQYINKRKSLENSKIIDLEDGANNSLAPKLGMESNEDASEVIQKKKGRKKLHNECKNTEEEINTIQEQTSVSNLASSHSKFPDTVLNLPENTTHNESEKTGRRTRNLRNSKKQEPSPSQSKPNLPIESDEISCKTRQRTSNNLDEKIPKRRGRKVKSEPEDIDVNTKPRTRSISVENSKNSLDSSIEYSLKSSRLMPKLSVTTSLSEDSGSELNVTKTSETNLEGEKFKRPGRKGKKNQLEDSADECTQRKRICKSPETKNIPKTRKQSCAVEVSLANSSSKNISEKELKSSFEPEKVMFTGYSDPKMPSLIKKLGGEVVDNPFTCTVLVTDKVRRTVKFLCAVGKGCPIVSPGWLLECRKAGAFISTSQHLLIDKEAEDKFGFNLKKSLEKSRCNKLLAGWTVHVTASVKPPPAEMKSIIESCSGSFLIKVPTSWPEKSVVISCAEDKAKWRSLHKRGTTPPIVSNEAILSGVLRQNFTINDYKISDV